jgi:3-keto-disaccharide hydrolase
MPSRGLRTACLILICSGASAILAQEAWRVHDTIRPNAPVVNPAATPGEAPSDAVVLFNGKTLDAFESQSGGPAQWTVESGYLEVKPGTGNIRTKQGFGDCQLHVEWASPNPPQNVDQMRGNSGVIIMGMYELQVLDSYNATTYADGQAGAIYGQYPPLVNAARPPGDWQTYDIVFRRPKFDEHGRLVSRARETVIHNGVVVQDASQLSGPTAYHNRPPYYPIAERLPLVLQDHGTPVRFRNIWIRDLAPERETLPANSFVPLRPDPKLYEQYAGSYAGGNTNMTLSVSGGKVTATVTTTSRQRESGVPFDLTPASDDTFWGRALPGMDLVPFVFTRGYESRESPVRTVVIYFGGRYIELTKK